MTTHDVSDAALGDWGYLWRELRKRTREPTANFPFVVYLVLGVMLFGGLGIWVELLKFVLSSPPTSLSGIITAVLTFFPTLIGTTSIQLVLDSANRGDKIFISFALLMFCIFVAFAVVLPIFASTHPVGVLRVSLGCCSCGMWLWWIANGGYSTFKTMPPLDAATGGSLERPLPGALGGFRV
jgi:hypothetical protein